MSTMENKQNVNQTIKKLSRNKIKQNLIKCLVIFIIVLFIYQIFQFSPNLSSLNIFLNNPINKKTFQERQIISSSSIQQPKTKVQSIIPSSTMIQHIHQSWKTRNIPPRFRKWSKSWQHCFPTWNYTLWTDEDNRNLVKQHYPWMLDFYDKLPAGIYRPDAIRFVYLYHYGGLYVDLDNECLRPFDHLLANYSLVFAAMQLPYKLIVTEGHVENSFMYSKPKHPFWMKIIRDMMSIKSKSSANPNTWTGPKLLEININRYRKQYGKELKIYEPKYFNPFSWEHFDSTPSYCRICNKMTSEDVEKCRKYFYENGSFVLQYHASTWKGGAVL